MKCENFLCIYEASGKCILDEVELDITGQCTACIYPNFYGDYLEKLKKQTIKYLDL